MLWDAVTGSVFHEYDFESGRKCPFHSLACRGVDVTSMTVNEATRTGAFRKLYQMVGANCLHHPDIDAWELQSICAVLAKTMLPGSLPGEMTASRTVAAIRAEDGNLRYVYYKSFDDPETVLIIDSWRDQTAIDAHHTSPVMATFALLREKYDLHMTIVRFIGAETPKSEDRFVRK